MAKKTSELRNIPPDKMKPNPENPRMIFRENEMRELLDSIREVGIKVPVSVYEDRNIFILLDGERRWRCAKKLNMQAVPALVQPKPGKLENLLMMFNIHNVRVQWDLLPMAYKLENVKKLLEKEERKEISHSELAGITGLSTSMVKRAFELLALPKKYQKTLIKEAEKPREEQRVTADLFIEINKALRAVERYTPEVMKCVRGREFVDAMYKKYINGVEKNLVNFRNISKIARAEKTGVSKSKVVPIIVDLVKRPNSRIDDAFARSVRSAYETRDLAAKVKSLISTLSGLSELPEGLKNPLLTLRNEIDKVLGNRK